MQELYAATRNRGKINEIDKLLEGRFEVRSIEDLGVTEDLPENGMTFEANALEKAMFIHKQYNVSCFADDSGLEVEALKGAPGVFSARFAGEARNDDDNMNLLLEKMKDVSNRNACFRTVIALVMDGAYYFFEGTINGTIGYEKKGGHGFGYDPLFVPQGSTLTFAQMTAAEKNRISHRAQAIQKMVAFLNTLKK